MPRQQSSLSKKSSLNGALCVYAFFSFASSLPSTASAQFLGFFGPKDYEECADKAAREAKNRDSLGILLQNCHSEFPGRKKPAGGYRYFDPRTGEYVDVSGPKFSAADVVAIEKQYQSFLVWRRAEENQRQAEEQRSQLQLEAFRRRTDETLSKLEITKRSLTTEGNYYCITGNLSISFRNNSRETINRVSIGFSSVGPDAKQCPNSLPQIATRDIVVRPGETSIVSVTSSDLCQNSNPRPYCASITGVSIENR